MRELINDDIFKGYGVEVYIQDDDFLKIAETLTRIGVLSKKNNALYQSCLILHKKGRYAIVHFKELFGLDGKEADISDNDYARRNTIVKLLSEWNLVTVKNQEDIVDTVPVSQIKILSYKEKDKYELVSKYSIGKVK